MDIANAAITQGATSLAQQVIKDTTASDLITKTIDKLNTTGSVSAPRLNPDYQFQKDVLSAAGIGRSLDISV
ncbi:MAG: hypothetical protein LBU06_11300 [Desulfovibrio sp.]|jgi:hypothetical protein|nr:hypothetical protein [Desulfovibrio sp.]